MSKLLKKALVKNLLHPVIYSSLICSSAYAGLVTINTTNATSSTGIGTDAGSAIASGSVLKMMPLGGGSLVGKIISESAALNSNTSIDRWSFTHADGELVITGDITGAYNWDYDLLIAPKNNSDIGDYVAYNDGRAGGNNVPKIQINIPQGDYIVAVGSYNLGFINNRTKVLDKNQFYSDYGGGFWGSPGDTTNRQYKLNFGSSVSNIQAFTSPPSGVNTYTPAGPAALSTPVTVNIDQATNIKALDVNGYLPSLNIQEDTSLGSVVNSLVGNNNKLTLKLTAGKTATLTGTGATLADDGIDVSANNYTALGTVDFNNTASAVVIDTSDDLEINASFVNASNGVVKLKNSTITSFTSQTLGTVGTIDFDSTSSTLAMATGKDNVINSEFTNANEATLKLADAYSTTITNATALTVKKIDFGGVASTIALATKTDNIIGAEFMDAYQSTLKLEDGKTTTITNPSVRDLGTIDFGGAIEAILDFNLGMDVDLNSNFKNAEKATIKFSDNNRMMNVNSSIGNVKTLDFLGNRFGLGINISPVQEEFINSGFLNAENITLSLLLPLGATSGSVVVTSSTIGALKGVVFQPNLTIATTQDVTIGAILDPTNADINIATASLLRFTNPSLGAVKNYNIGLDALGPKAAINGNLVLSPSASTVANSVMTAVNQMALGAAGFKSSFRFNSADSQLTIDTENATADLAIINNDADSKVTPAQDGYGIVNISADKQKLTLDGISFGDSGALRLKKLTLTGSKEIDASSSNIYAQQLDLNTDIFSSWGNIALGSNASVNVKKSTGVIMSTGFNADSPTIDLGNKTLSIVGGDNKISGALSVKTAFDCNSNDRGAIFLSCQGISGNCKLDLSGVTAVNIELNDTSTDLPAIGTRYSFPLFFTDGTNNNIINTNAPVTLTTQQKNSYIKWSYNSLELQTDISVAPPTNNNSSNNTNTNTNTDSGSNTLDIATDTATNIPNVTTSNNFAGYVVVAEPDVSSLTQNLISVNASPETNQIAQELANSVIANNNQAALDLTSQLGTQTNEDQATTLESMITNDTGMIAISEANDMLQRNVMDRILSNLGDDINSQALPVAAASAGDENDDVNIKLTKYGVWASPFTQYAKQKADGSNGGYTLRNNGITLGGDIMPTDNITTGLAWTNAKA